MKINSFKAQKVHDYLNFDIEFFPDLTFLIGINGSGKTSALKLILGLTSPSFNYLNQIEFESCEVVCSTFNNERDIIIKAEQNKLNGTFSMYLTLSNQLFQVEPTVIKRFLRNQEDPYDLDEISMLEQRHREIFDNLEVTKSIRELATPKFLGLDRRIYEGRLIDYRYKKRQFAGSVYRKRSTEKYLDAPAIDTSLDDVQNLVFDYIRKISQQQSQFSEEFKQKIFSQSFSFVKDYSAGPIPSTDEIEKRKQEVLTAIENLGIKYLDYSVNLFFDEITAITKKIESFSEEEKDISSNTYNKEYLDILIKWNNNSFQLKRVDDLISYSQEYQKKIAELRAPMKRLENITSNFLKEGKKNLRIEPDGEIRVALKNRRFANIFELSSGEKQIIIMIAHLIFEEDQKDSGIFIIDEPELSLHIAWQEIFVNSIIQASPKTQFILATHSPSIIANVDKEKYCQDLNKLNN
jgi:predicted ATP-dependent endonuclease of OLD family